ncbi:MAG: hypothetical protein K5924_04975, partial [Chloroflexi bacterium]|nr:hypothetical protein [Chloroflexota bacterium]
MPHSSDRMIAPSIARTMFAIFAVLALAFSAVAIATPALAVDHGGTDVDLHQSTPIASDDEEFTGTDAECRDVESGEALWHFVLNKLDAGTSAGELYATFDHAGSVVASGTIISDASQVQVQHFDVIVGSGDTLLSAYASVDSQSADTGNGPMLVLSHVCDGGEAEGSPSPSQSEEPDRDVTIMVMKHNCANVSSTDEFDAVEARAATNP